AGDLTPLAAKLNFFYPMLSLLSASHAGTQSGTRASPTYDRRLIIFTEWEDTRRWIEKRVREACSYTARAYERTDICTGIAGQYRREEVKAALNAEPAKEPPRILICPDAAREGINLQTYCPDLILQVRADRQG